MAASKSTTPALSANVVRIDGKAYLRTPEGLIALKAGDRIEQGQEIVVDAKGQLQIRLPNGELLDLGGGRSVRADEDMLGQNTERSEAAVKTPSATDAEAVLAALNAGEDPFATLDPAAAGLGAGGAEGGHGFVRLLRITEELSPLEFQSGTSFVAEAINIPNGNDDTPQATAPADIQPPSPSISLNSNITPDDIINATEAGQSIAITGSVGGDAKVGDTVTLTVNGKDFVGTVAADKSFSINVPGADLVADNDSTIDARVNTTDAAGNTSSATSRESYSVDTNPPSVVVNVTDSALNSGDKVSTVTFTFSEAPGGFSAADITAVGGTISGLTATSDPRIFTATFTATDGFSGTGSVTVANASYTDSAGNPGTAGSDTVAIDTVAPGVSINIVDTALNNGDKISTVTFTFSEAPSGFSAADITAVGGTISGLTATADPKVFTATFTATDGFSGTGSVTVANASYTDAAGNSGTAGSDTVAINTVAPGVSVDIVDAALNVADKVSTVTFSFSEAPVGFTAADISAVGGTVTGLTQVDATHWTATFTANDAFTGTASVSVAAGSYTNAAGNAGTAGTDSVPVDTAPPVPTITLDAAITPDDIINATEAGQSIAITGVVGGDAKVGDTVTLTVNGKDFSGTVVSTAGVLGFSIAVPGADLVADSDATIDARVTTTDAAGNSASATDTEGYSVNTGAPTVTVDIVDAALNVADKVSTVTFSFSEAPVGFTAADISAVGGTVTGLTQVDATHWTATFTANDAFTGTASVSVAAGSYTNAAGNAGTAGTDSVPVDTAAPVPTITLDAAITPDDIINATEAGQSIAITGTVGGDAKAGDTVTLTVNGKDFSGAVVSTAGVLGFSIAVPGADLVADSDATIQASVSTTDAAGNSASATDTEAYSVNTGAPTVTVDIVDAALNVADKVSTVTFSFSEAPVGFTAADISAVGGTVTGLTQVDATHWTATFTANDAFTGTASVSVAAGSYTNAAGNAGTAGTDSVPVDTAPPVPTITLDAAITPDDIINATEAGQSIAITGTVGGDAKVGDTVTLTVNGKDFSGSVVSTAGVLGFSIAVPGADLVADSNATIDARVTTTDAAGNSASATDTEGYSVNTGAPTVTVDIVDAALNVADKVSTVTFSFSEAPVGFTAADISAVGGTVTGLTQVDATHWTATFTANDAFTGTASVSVAAGSYTNAAGNAGTAGTDSVPVDTAAPVPTITLDAAITPDDIINATEAGQSIAITGVVGGDAKVGDTVTLTVNGKDFSGAVVSTAGVLGFSIAVPGADLVADSDATIDARVTTTDAAGNSASATDTEAYSVNTGAPTVTVDIVDAALNVADKVSTVTFSFSEAPVGFTAADISAVGGTISGLTATADPKVFTATFTANDAFTGTASVSVAAGSYTNAAGNAGTAGTDSVPVDTAAPVPTITLDASITPDDIINATEAGQSIAITGVVGGDAKVGDTVTLTVNGKDFSGTVVSTAGVLGFSIAVPGADLVADSNATIDARVTTTDAAGNSASATDTEGYSVNTGAPTVTVDIVDTALNVADKVSTVTFSFSEAPVGFTAADISAVGGTISGLTATADPKVFTATFTANDAFTGTASVSVAAGSYTNAAGNAGTAGTDSVPVDTAPPVPTITLDAAITPDDIINATEAGQSIAITGTVGGDAKAGDTVTLTVNGKDFSGSVVSTAGVLGFSIAVPGADLVADSNATIDARVTTTDAAGNSASATDTEGYSVNTGAPTVTVDIVDAALNVADKVSTVTFSFSEAPVGFTAADISAVGGTVTGLTQVDATHWTATFTANDAFTGTASVSVAAGSYTNAAGNAGTAGTDSVPVDTAPPVPTITLDAAITPDDIINATEAGQSIAITGTVGGDAKVGDTVTLTVNGKDFSGTVVSTAGVLGFSIAVPGADLVADSDATIQASVSTTDAAGNSASATDTEAYSVNTGAPTVTVDIVDAALNVADKVSTVTFSFSEAPVGFTAADISAVGGTVTGLTQVDATHWTATFTANDAFTGTASVSVAAGSYTNAAGNAGTAGTDSVPVDTAAPVPTITLDASITPDDIINATEAGQSIAITGVVGGDAKVGDTVTLTVNGKDFSGSVVSTAGVLGFSIAVPGADLVADSDATIDARVTTTDAAGNSASATDTEAYSVNTGAPTVTVDIVDAALNVADKVSTVTFSFSEAPVGFTAADISAVGGTVTGLTQVDATHWTATFTANDAFTGTASVSVAAGSYTNAAGNAGTAGTDSVPVDTAPPVPTITLDASITPDDIINATEAGQSIAITGTVGGDAKAGDTVTLTVNGKDFSGTVVSTAGVLGFSIAVPGADLVADSDATIDARVTTTDAAGNSASATDTEAYSVNTGAPTVTVDIVDAALNVADKVSTVTFSFSEAPVGFTAADITAVGGTISGLTATADPKVFTATFTANDAFTGTASVSVAAGSYTNAAGNAGTAGTDSVPVDTAPPVPTITLDAAITPDDIINATEAGQSIAITGTVGGDAKVGDTVTLTVNGKDFSGSVVSTAGVLGFSIAVPGADLVADSNATIDARVTTTDAAGNSASATDTEAYSVNTGAPTVTVDIVDAALNVADKVSTVTFSFSEAPVGFTAADISAVGGTISGLTATADPKVFTATFTANDAFTGTASVSVAAGSYTNAAGNAGTAGTDSVPVDTAAPVPTITLDASITPDDIINATEAGQSIAITGVVGGDAKVGDTVTLTVNGKDFSGTVVSTAGVLGFSIAVPGADLVADSNATIDARVTTTDAAGNSASATDTEGYSVNTGAPTVTVDIVDTALNVADKVSTVTFSFSEAPVGFTAADISAVGGTISGLTATADPKVFTATFTANDAFTGTASVSVAAGSYTNAAGNAGTAGTDSVPVDTAPPVPTITLDAAITPDDIINATEAGQSIAITGTVGGDAKAGDTVTLTVNGKDFSGSVVSTAGVLGFSIAVPGADLVADSNATIDARVTTTDAAGNSASATDTEAYSVNTGAPTVTVDIVDAALNVADKVSTVTFSFSEAPVGFTAADISAVGGTVTGLTQVDATHWTATFTANDAFTGTASVSVAAGSYTNAAGNAGTAGTDSVPVDTAPPVPTITLDAAITPDDIINATEAGQSIAITGTVGGDAKVGDTVTLTVNGKDFSGTVVSTAGVLGFSIAVPGADLVADSDATIQASVSTTDAAGNSASATDTEGYSVNTGAPTVTVDIAATALNVADKTSLVSFTFSEAPVGFTAADITIVGGTIIGLTQVSSTRWDATFTANDAFTGTASVSVAAGSYTNAAGNAGTAGTDSVPVDTAAPVPTITLDAAITPDDIINATEAGQSIAITGVVGGDAKVGDTVTLTVNGKDFSGTVVSTAGVLGFSIAVPGADLVADSNATIQASVSTTDAAGNSASATDTEGYSVNTGAPTVTVDIVDTALNVADKVSTVTFSFSEAPVGFTAADISAVGGTISGLTATADPKVFTATFTANDAFTGTASVSVAAGSYTNAAGNAGTAGTDSVPVDTAPPVPTITLDAAITPDDIINATEAGQSIAITGTVGGDAKVGDTVTLTVNGKDFSGSVVSTAGVLGFSIAVPGADLVADSNATIDARVTTTDAAGNSASATDTEAYSVNTGAPTVTVDIVDAALNVADKVSTVTFSFSEAPVGFTAADISAVGGTISGLTATADPKVFTATFTANDAFTGTASVSVAAGSYTNAAGNAGTAGTDSVPVDTAPPVPTITLDAAITPDDIINATEAGQSIAITGTVGGDAKAGDTVTLTVNGKDFSGSVVSTAGVLGFSIAVPGADLVADSNATIDARVTTTDAAGNSASATDTEAYSVNTGAPTVTVDIVDAALNVADKVSTVTFSFSEAPVGFTAADISAVGGTVTGLTQVDATHWTATFTANDAFTGTASVSVAAGSYTNAAGNAGTAGTDSVPVDTAPPVPTITLDAAITPDDIINATEAGQSIAITGTVGGDAKVGDTVTLTVNGKDFSGTVVSTAGVLGFSIAVPGADLVADSDATIQASVSTTDAAGNSASATDTEGYSVNTGAPTVTVDIAATALNVADKTSLVSFTFSEAPVGFTAADITIVGGTIIGLTQVSSTRWDATFTANDAFTGTASVSVAAGSYTNAAGNAGTAGTDSVPVDTAPPVPTITLDAAITPDDIINATEAGQSIAITGVVGGDAKVGDTVTLTVNGKDFSGTVVSTAGVLGFSIAVPGADLVADSNATIDARVTTTDAAGNSASATDTEGYSVNTGAPTVTVDIVDTALNVADKVSTVTFSFSEAPVGFTAADISAVGGTISGLTATADPKVFTATFTANDAFTGTASVSVAAGSYTNAAGNAGTAGTDSVPVDTAPPVPTITLDAAITPDDIINATEAGQSIAITGTVGGDAKAGDTVTLTVNGKDFSGTVVSTAGVLGFSIAVPGADLVADSNATIDARVTTTDAAGNSASATDTEGYSVNTGAPTVTVDIVDAALNVADKVSTVTFSFSEAPVGFTAADISAVGGTVTGLTQVDATHWTATFTANDAFTGTASVSVAAGSYTNAAGNAGTAGTDSVPVDTAAPVPTITLDASITPDDIINATEAGQSIAITGVVGGDAKVGDTVTLTVNGKDFSGTVVSTAGVLGFSIAVPGADLVADSNATIQASVSTTDAAGNSASATDTEGYSVNTGAPTVTVDIVDTALNVADKVSTVTFSFSEAPVGFTAADISAVGGTISGLTATADPKVFTATFTANDAFTGTASVSVAAGSYTNAAGNAGTAGTDSVPVDTAPPVPTITLDAAITPDDIINATEAGQSIAITGTVGGDAKVGDTVTLTVNGKDFSGSVVSTAGVLGFSIAVPGADLVADSNATIDARVTTTDAAGNSASATDTEAYSVNTGAPTVTVDIVDAALNVADKVSTVTFSFSEAPVGFTAADITAVGGTISGLTATADPKVFTATFTANDAFTGTASVSVAAGSYTNAAGNAGTAGTDSVPVDTAPPVPTITLDASITPDDIINATEAGQSIAITGTVGGDAKAGDTVTLTVNGKDFSGAVVSTAGVLGFSIAVPGADLVADSNATIDARVTTTDAAGNSASATDTEGYSVNTGAPTVTVDIVDTALNVADKVSTVTFSFSEAPVGFTAADISAVGGTISGLTATADPKVFTATFTANDAFTGTASVSVAAGSYTNAAGNAGTAGTDSVPVDTAPPVPTITLDAAITPDDIINATEAGQSIAITGTVGGDAKAGDTVTLTVNGKDFSGTVVSTAGVLGFSIAVPGADLIADSDATIQASVSTTDAAGNSASATDTEAYSVNTGAPTVTVDIVDAALNVADKVSTVTFSFSEAPVGFTAADISAVGGTVTGLTQVDATHWTATFTANDAFTGTASVSVAAGSYTNAAGNTGTAGTDSVPVDTAPPVPTITLDAAITPDDIINATEAGQSIAITGTVGGDAKVGDTVTLTVNGKDFSGTVVSTAGVLGFSIAVPGADLVADSDATIQASVSTTDAAGNSASATDTESYSVNHVPVAVADLATVSEDAVNITGNVTPGTSGQDSDPDANTTLTVVGVAAGTQTSASGNVGSSVAGSYGSVVINANGSYTYTPGAGAQTLAAGQTTTDTFTYTISDGLGGTASTTLSVTVQGANDAPVNTVAGAQTVTEDSAKAITGVSVADVDSSSLTTTVSVLHGTLSVTTGGGATITNNGTGTVTLVGTAAQINAALAGLTYTNTADYNGTDTVTVVTSDGTLSDTDSIAITVNPVADIANDTATTNEDTPVNINVNSNDSFENSGHTITAINGTAIAVGGSVAVANGSVTLKADGTLDFTPTANYNGAASFTYTVTSGGVTETATVNVTVAAVNDTPVNTVAGAQTVTEDSAKAITGVSVADVDSSSLTTTVSVLHGTLSVTTGGGATITNNGTGTVTLVGTATQINAALAGLTYTNTADYNGTDTVTVVTSDGALSDTDSIAITVNAVADIANDTATTNEDTPVNINVNSNDSFENSGHTITAINGTAIAVGGSVAVANGSVTLKADGTLDFTPTANYNGAASFTYTVTSGGVTETATVNVTVAAVNDTPVNTVAGAQTVTEDSAKAITGVSVADVDSSSLTTTVSVLHGTLSVTTGGGATITNNGTGTVTLVGTATQINAALAGLTYTNTADYNGTDTVTVVTSDGALSDTDTIAVTVNAVADIANDTATTNEDTPVNINVNSNDSFENSGHTITAINGSAIAVGGSVAVTNGSVTLKADGTLDFTPTANYNGAASFTYTVTSGGVTETATVNVTVAAVNDTPVNTVAGAQTVTEDSAKAITGVSVADVDSSSLTTTVSVLHGTLSVTTGGGATITNNGTGTVTLVGTAAQINAALAGLSYTNTADYNGTDTVTVVTSDGALSDTDTIAVTVNAVADIANDTATTNEDTPVNINVNSNDSFENSGHTITAINGTAIAVGGSVAVTNGSVTLKADGTLDFTPTANYNGAASFTYTVTSGGVSETATVNVTVAAVNDAPVNTMPASFTTLEDTSKTLTGLSISDVDAGTGSLTVTLVVNNGVLNVSGGGASIAGSGSSIVTLTGTVAQINATLAASVNYVPNSNFNGTDTLAMSTSDGGNTGSGGTLTDNDSVSITVTPVNDAPVNSLATSYSTVEDTALKLSGLSVADVDAASGSMSVTLNVSSGSLAATSGSGVTISGSGTSALTLTGTLSSLNAYLATSSSMPVFTPASNATADVTLTMTTNDNGNTGGAALTDVDTRTITITPVNDAAVLTADSATTNEDTAVSGNVLSNDTDVDSALTVGSFTWNGTTYSAGATATITGVGSLRIGSNGAYTFTPASNYNGSVPTATYSVLEDGSTSASSTLSLGITPLNDAPVNTVKTFSTSAPTTGTTYISLGGMSVTDVDAGTSTITVTFKVSTTYGALAATGSTSYGVTSSTSTTSGVQTLTLTGTLTAINTYLALTTGTSAAGNGLKFSTTSGSTTGTADLTMTSSDGSLTDTDVTTITIAETSTTGNADPDTGTLTEDTTSALTGNVLTNDQGNTKSVSLVSFEGVTQTIGTAFSTNYGTLTITSTGAYTYTVNNSAVQYLAAGQSITETVVYRETYSTGTDTSTLTITITGANDAPVISATSVAVSGTEDTAYIFSWAQFGISDVDTSNTLYVQVSTLPSDGTLQYYNGSAWVSVTTGQNISKSDIDAGYFRFVPDSNESGADIYGASGTGNMKNDYASFTFKGYDGTTTSSATGTVTIDITPVADDAKLTVGGVSVIDGSTLIVTPPASDGLTVRQYTSIGNISTATVDTLAEVQSLLTLLDANTASSTTISTTPQNYTANTNSDPSGIPTDGATRITGLIYLEAGHTYTFSSYMDDTALLVVGGTVLMAKQYNSWGNITATSYTVTVSGYYTIDWAVYNGNSIGAFKPYLSVDGGTALELTSSNFLIYSSLAAVEAAGGVHDAVVGSSTAGYYPVSNSGVEDTAISISPITISLSDSDGSESMASLVATDLLVGTVLTDGTNTFTATSGNTSVNITSWNLSTLKITPPLNFSGNYSLELTLTSKENATGELATNSTTLTIPVAPVQDAPVSANDTASVVEDSGSYVVSGNVMSNDSDPDGDAITVTAVNRQSVLLGADVASLYGYFHINADGSYTYTLNNDDARVNALNTSQTLTDSITYTIADTEGLTSTSTLTITINGASDSYSTSSTISGTTGADSLSGTSAADLIQSLAGNDYIEAGAGHDVVRTGDASGTATQTELAASAFMTTADASMTDSNGLLTVADATHKAYGDLANGGTGNDALIGSGSGTHLLYGGAGDDYLLGGTSTDALRGGAGNDRIEGGAGNDVMRGDLGADVFAWSLNDQASASGTTAALAGNVYGVAAGIGLSSTTDLVTDFSKTDGDVLDLRDLLSGESHLGVDPGNLSNYLHFEVSNGNTVVHISSTGGFTSGTYDATKEDQTIVLQGVNLLNDGTASLLSDNAVIQDMLKNNRLIVD